MNTFYNCVAGMLFAVAAVPALADPPPAGNQVRPVDFFIEPPTLNNLAFEWRIDGDDNRNAVVQVFYRQKGNTQWKQGMNLFRLQGERTLENVRFDVISPNMFSGSIVDLQPNTEYECSTSIRTTRRMRRRLANRGSTISKAYWRPITTAHPEPT